MIEQLPPSCNQNILVVLSEKQLDLATQFLESWGETRIPNCKVLQEYIELAIDENDSQCWPVLELLLERHGCQPFSELNTHLVSWIETVFKTQETHQAEALNNFLIKWATLDIDHHSEDLEKSALASFKDKYKLKKLMSLLMQKCSLGAAWIHLLGVLALEDVINKETWLMESLPLLDEKELFDLLSNYRPLVKSRLLDRFLEKICSYPTKERGLIGTDFSFEKLKVHLQHSKCGHKKNTILHQELLGYLVMCWIQFQVPLKIVKELVPNVQDACDRLQVGPESALTMSLYMMSLLSKD
jgi:hypothetical protein